MAAIDRLQIVDFSANEKMLKLYAQAKEGRGTAVIVKLSRDETDDTMEIHLGYWSDGGWHPTRYPVTFVHGEKRYTISERMPNSEKPSSFLAVSDDIASILDKDQHTLFYEVRKTLLTRIKSTVECYQHRDGYYDDLGKLTRDRANLDEHRCRFTSEAARE